MNQNSNEKNIKERRTLAQRLFNPFRFVAGYQALLIGLAAIVLTSHIGSLSNTHFDGVLDVHAGLQAPLWFFLAEGLINWISLVVPLFILGLVISRSSFRTIDLIGTQALARWPHLVTATVMLPAANQKVLEYLISKCTQGQTAAPPDPTDVAIFVVAMFLTILMLIWMVALMYKAYTVSCNIKGPKAIVTFIIGLIGAEVLSKVAVLLLAYNL
jgi:hypothetical protein